MKISAIWPWIMVISAGIGLRVGIASVSPLLDRIQNAFGVSAAAVALLTAIPVICMGGLSFLGSLVERHWGLKRGMVLALSMLVVGLLWRGWASSFAVLLLTAVIVGIGDALVRPLLSGFIKQTFDQTTHAVMGLYAASMGIGAALSAYATPWLADTLPSWQWGLGGWALLAALALLIWGGWSAPAVVHTDPVITKAPLAGKVVLWLTLFFGMQAGVNYTVVAWLPSVGVGIGVSHAVATYLMALFLGVQTLTSLLFPVLLHRMGLRLMTASVVFSALTLAGVFMLTTASGLWGAAILLGIGTGGLFPIALSLPLAFSTSAREATRLSSFSQSGGYALGGLMPWAAGLIAPSLGAVTAVVLLSLLMMLLLAIVTWRVAFHHARYTA